MSHWRQSSIVYCLLLAFVAIRFMDIHDLSGFHTNLKKKMVAVHVSTKTLQSIPGEEPGVRGPHSYQIQWSYGAHNHVFPA